MHMKQNNVARRSNKPLVDTRLRSKALDNLKTSTTSPKQSSNSNTTMPVVLTPFIGRYNEIAAVSRLLVNPAVHLVTLTGAAGTGKTRLSMAVAEKLRAEFEDGIYFVNLAPISRPEAGLIAIAQGLGLQDHSQLSPLHKLQIFLKDQNVLLVLDNFEQILELGPAISELLVAAPRLKILLTSRIVLHLYGENVYFVPTLNVTELDKDASFETVSQNEAVRVFTQHASMVNSDFKLTERNYRQVAALCRHLEGLPLSIELAAARSDVFSVQALLERLQTGPRYEMLNKGFANLPSRQQTLAGAIEWSYRLLTEPEKRVFRKISLFVSCGTAGAAQMLDHGNPATLEIITSLLNKSFLKRVEMPAAGEICFTMLETIREFALAKLTEEGELEETWNLYCDLFIELVETGAVQLQKPTHAAWLKCLLVNHPNILSALDYLIEKGDVQRAYHLGAFVWVAWWNWGYLNEGRQWLNKLLNLDRSQVDIELQAHLLEGVGYLATQQADNRFAQPYFEEALAIWRSKEPGSNLAGTLSALADNYRSLGNFNRALELSYESLELFRKLGEKVHEANVLCNIGWQLMDRGQYEPVQAMMEESITLHTEANHPFGIARARICLGEFYWRQGQTAQAIETLEESIRFLRQDPHKIWLSCGLSRLGLIYLCENQLELAQKLLEEALDKDLEMEKQRDLVFDYGILGLLELSRNELEKAEAYFQAGLNNSANIVNEEGVVWLKEGMAVLAIEKDNLAEATELLAKAGQMRQENDVPFLPHTVRFILPVLKKHELLSGVYQPLNFGKQPLRKESKTSPGQDTITAGSSHKSTSTAAYQYPNSELSKRESEVLQLVAQGHQTSQIAQILVISPGTVNNHLNSIYSKLGVNSRTRAVRYALDNGLLI